MDFRVSSKPLFILTPLKEAEKAHRNLYGWLVILC